MGLNGAIGGDPCGGPMRARGLDVTTALEDRDDPPTVGDVERFVQMIRVLGRLVPVSGYLGICRDFSSGPGRGRWCLICGR